MWCDLTVARRRPLSSQAADRRLLAELRLSWFVASSFLVAENLTLRTEHRRYCSRNSRLRCLCLSPHYGVDLSKNAYPNADLLRV